MFFEIHCWGGHNSDKHFHNISRNDRGRKMGSPAKPFFPILKFLVNLIKRRRKYVRINVDQWGRRERPSAASVLEPIGHYWSPWSQSHFRLTVHCNPLSTGCAPLTHFNVLRMHSASRTTEERKLINSSQHFKLLFFTSTAGVSEQCKEGCSVFTKMIPLKARYGIKYPRYIVSPLETLFSEGVLML